MGHVVNSKGLRLGWSSSWCDYWFSELFFYPEYLHSIFRIRFYLVYFLTRKYFRKLDIFYSHFYILQGFRNIEIYIYYYSATLEDSIYTLCDDLYKGIKGSPKRYKKKK
jgi:hypothetical protein